MRHTIARARSAVGRMSDLPWWARVAVTLGVFALIAWIDFATPNYVSVTGFYLLPIVVAARYGDEGTFGLVLGLSTMVSLYMAELLLPADAAGWSRAMSYCSVLLFFGGIGVLVWRVRGAYARLEKASRTDPLTGLGNRRAYAELDVTASIGVVAADGAAGAARAEDILRTADAAMYAVKNGSKNSVRVVDPSGCAAASTLA